MCVKLLPSTSIDVLAYGRNPSSFLHIKPKGIIANNQVLSTDFDNCSNLFCEDVFDFIANFETHI